MTIGALGVSAVVGSAAASDQALHHYWHQWWFVLVVVAFGMVVLIGFWIVLAGAIPSVPPRSWTSHAETAGSEIHDATISAEGEDAEEIVGLDADAPASVKNSRISAKGKAKRVIGARLKSSVPSENPSTKGSGEDV